jgi:hypothetical protein
VITANSCGRLDSLFLLPGSLWGVTRSRAFLASYEAVMVSGWFLHWDLLLQVDISESWEKTLLRARHRHVAKALPPVYALSSAFLSLTDSR